MSVYTVNCKFPNTATPLSNVTSGWDVVYAVKYSAINEVLLDHQPWAVIDFGGGDGKVSSSSNTYQLDGDVSTLQVLRGASGQEMYFALTIVNAVLSDPIAGTQVATYSSIEAKIRVVLKVSQTGVAGLRTLKVDLDTAPVVIATSSPDSPLLPSDIQVIISGLCQDATVQTMFDVDIMQIYDDRYARGVNIPWGLPKAFSYACADLIDPADDGVLAVLGSVSGNTAGLSPQINPLAIPTDTDINAVVLLNSNLVSRSTFVEAMNNQLGDAMLGSLSYNAETGSISNNDDLTLYYVRDDAGNISLLDADSALSDTSEKYPALVPAGALRFTIGDNSITAAINSATVKFDDYSIVLSVKYNFQIKATDSGDIDIFLYGEPEIVANIASGPKSPTSTWANFLGVIGGILLSELMVAGVDWLGNLTGRMMTNKRVTELALDFMAANEEAMMGRRPVKFKLGMLREGGVEYIDYSDRNAPAYKMTKQDLARTRLPKAAEFHAPGMNGPYQQLEMTTINNGAVHPQPQGNPGNRGNQGQPAPRPQTPVQQHPNVMVDRGPAEVRVALEPRPIREGLGKLLKAFEDHCVEPGDDHLRRKFLVEVSEKLAGENPQALEGWGRRLRRDMLAARANEETGEWSASADGRRAYAKSVELLESWFHKGVISDTQYLAMVSDMQFLVSGEALKSGPFPFRRKLYAMFGDKEMPVPEGLTAEINTALDLGNNAYSLKAARDFIREVPRPAAMKYLGYGLYLAGLAAGQFGSEYAQKAADAVFPPQQNSDLESISQGGAKPTNIFLKTVDFPLMRRPDGDPTAPKPANILVSAAVYGGLVLGVKI
ncbi:DUF4097 domain-containing protein [Bordetella sp. LUAb4]|uniref:DUF4097 domain-containing protein n=1 Tax=Bordetella sp. LUAb4 TaxID=2843195 RepID=UPI001E528DEC|nr:DUF4097 domain-containing protein [Bordetella sp. LUAb4]